MFGRLSRGSRIAVSAAAVVVILVAVGLFWWFQRDEGPEAVDLETAVAQFEAAEQDSRNGDTAVASDTSAEANEAQDDTGSGDSAETATMAPSDDDPASDSGGPDDDDTLDDTDSSGSSSDGTTAGTDEGDSDDAAEQTDAAPGGVAGVWTVQVADGNVDLLSEPAVSFAGFRVDEVLAGGIGDFTAVGRTADVSGSIELTDTALAAATVEVTMATLRTDNSNRDSRMRQALDTSEFPSATFTLTEPVDIGAGAAAGEAFSGSAVGELTVKGVTNRVTFDLQAQLVGDSIVAVGSSEVVFSDYGVTAPTAPIVVSVEDHGIMEFQLIFTR